MGVEISEGFFLTCMAPVLYCYLPSLKHENSHKSIEKNPFNLHPGQCQYIRPSRHTFIIKLMSLYEIRRYM